MMETDVVVGSGMKVVCSRDELVAKLGVVARAVSTRTTVQILSGVLLQAEAGRLLLAATDMELSLYREYRDIVAQFSYVVETERRFYLANSVDVAVRNADGEVYFEVRMSDAWVWDMYRPARFVKNVRVVTFKDVNVEELAKSELQLPKGDF